MASQTTILAVLLAVVALTQAAPSARAAFLYVSDVGLNTGVGANTIERFDSSGNGTAYVSGGGLNTPEGLAFDSSGNLYVSSSGDLTLRKITPGGVQSVVYDFHNSGSNRPEGLALDSAGNLYVANGPNIDKFAPSGNHTVFASSGLNDVQGLAFDSAGNLYAADLANSSIYKYAPNGSRTTFATGDSTLHNPYGLAVDSANNVYVAYNSTKIIRKFDPTGATSTTFASGLSGPIGLAFDSAGNLYTGNNGEIDRFDAAGNRTAFATSSVYSPTYLTFGPDLAGGAAAAPEPSSIMMMGVGLVGIIPVLRRRGKRHA